MKKCVFSCNKQEEIEALYKKYCDWINWPTHWKDDKVQVMYNIMSDANLVISDTPHYYVFEFWNTFWGVNKEGIGQNVLGRILMHIRHERRTGISAPFCRRFPR